MKRVIVIGGGFAGSQIARKLESKFKVTLFDTKEYFEFTPSVLRTIVEPAHAKKIQVLHTNYLKQAKIVLGKVSKITDSYVICKKKKYKFDYLAICSGSKYDTPIKASNVVVAARGKELREFCGKVQNAKRIVIIGGGTVGVELAAEIIEHFPNKEITIVHSKARLLERSLPKAQQFAKKWLQKRGVRIIFNDRVEKHKNNVYITKKKKRVSADVAFMCVGIKPNSQYLAKCEVELTDSNYLCVNGYLQVQGKTHIFAAGDITNINEEKTAQAAEKQACVVAKNIWALEKGKKLTSYESVQRPMIISLGKNNGIIMYKGKVLTGLLAGLIKRIVEYKEMHKLR